VAYQALINISYVQEQADMMIYSPAHHAISGNGNRAGLLRFFPGLPIKGDSMSAQNAQQAALIHLRDYISERAGPIFGNKKSQWDLQAAEHTPCEWIKFRRGVIFYALMFGITLKGSPDPQGARRPRRARRDVQRPF